MNKNYTIIREKDFIGYDDRRGADFLSRGYVADALNCFMRSGQIVKRNGYTIIGNTIGAFACQGLKGAQFASGTKELIGVFNGGIYKWTGSGSWSSLGGSLSTTESVDMVMANNAMYFFDGTSTVHKYNGSAISTVAAIPIGKFARWFHNQLHVAGISGSPNKLRSSEIGDPETFSGGNSSNLDVNPNDGDEITALNELNDALIIFKKRRVWSATGFGTSALTLAGIKENVSGFGALSHRGVVNTGNDLLYIGFLGDRPIVRSLQRTRFGTIVDAGNVSITIEGTMNGLNKAQLSKSAGVFDGRYAWFAVPNGSSTTNNLCITYDTARNGWTRHTGINASVFESFAISTQPQLYFGEATASAKAYVFDTSTSDNGTAIAFSVKTRRYGAEDDEVKKKFKYLYVTAEESGDYDLTIQYSVDGFTYSTLDTMNLSGTGAVFDTIILDTSRLGTTDTKKKRFVIPKSRHYYIQFQVTNTSATSSVTIRNWDLLYQKKRPIEV